MTKFGLTQTVAPAAVVITTAQAKTHCGIAAADTSFDTYVDTLVAAALFHVETLTNQQLYTATWAMTLDALPTGTRELLLPITPVASVTSVVYTDAAGDEQTWNSSNYVVSTDRKPARIRPAYNIVWPTTRKEPDANVITFVCGYGNAASVPASYVHAMKLLVKHWFDNGSAVVVGTIAASLPLGFQPLLNTMNLGDDHLEYA